MFRNSAERFTVITTLLLSCYISVMECQTFTTILLPDTGSRVCQGSSITLRCRVTFRGEVLDGNWRRNGSSLSGNSTNNHFITPFNSTGEGLTDLIITNFGLADDNTEYSCSFSIFTSDSVVLHVAGPPATSTNVIAVNICLTDFTASWDPVTSDPVCGPVSYDVTISSSNGVMMMRITDTSYNFTGLIPDSSYTVTVAGINNAGVGRSSSTTIRTFQDRPPPVVNVSAITSFNVSKLEVTVSWQVPMTTTRCIPPITGYLLTITFDGTSLDDVNVPFGVTTINMSDYFTDHPLVNTLYTISVSVLSDGGRSNPLSITHETFFHLQTSSTPRLINNTITSLCAVASSSTTPLHCRMIIQCVDCDSLCGVDSVFNGATVMRWPLPIGHHCIVTMFAVDGNGIGVEEYRITETFTVPGRHVSNESSDDDDDLSTGAAVAISIVVTFIITLVVTAAMTYIITSLYYKYQYERSKHSDHNRPPVEREASIPGDDLYIPTGTTIKMDNNPAYATTNY